VIVERALSIRQPWAYLILLGAKVIENRTWETMWTGRFVVHAGKKTDPDGFDFCERHQIPLPDDLPLGAYLGTADLLGVHKADAPYCCAPWGAAGQYHWVLDKAEPFDVALPGKGSLGLYRLTDPAVIAAANAFRSPT
jgi:hypothetical protein